jgi:hypothetical protein
VERFHPKADFGMAFLWVFSIFLPPFLHTVQDYHPDFHYRGRNGYAYMWAAAPPGTLDLVAGRGGHPGGTGKQFVADNKSSKNPTDI